MSRARSRIEAAGDLVQPHEGPRHRLRTHIDRQILDELKGRRAAQMDTMRAYRQLEMVFVQRNRAGDKGELFKNLANETGIMEIDANRGSKQLIRQDGQRSARPEIGRCRGS